MKLEEYEQNFNKAKEVYKEIMKGENDASILFKWMIENEINPYSIFHEKVYASMTSTLEGMIGLYHTLHHALYDDGDVTFVNTYGNGPKILFACKYEDYFQSHYDSLVQKGCEKISKIVGFCNNVNEFIQEYNIYETKRNELIEWINEHRRGNK